MTLFATAIAPPQLETIRASISKLIPEAKDGFDRRGFRLLHWPSPVSERKPIELSLEHEARLKPTKQQSVSRLLAALQATEERELGYKVLPGDGVFGGLVLQKVHRSPGPQSLDRYFDTPYSATQTFLRLGYTFRQRLRGRDFMTWGNAGESVYALNLELPSVGLGLSGLTARLEFNWLDDVARTFEEAFHGSLDAQQRNPVFLTQTISGIDLSLLSPVIEIETVRHKYQVISTASQQVALVINVDLISAKSLREGHADSFADVDISCVDRIRETEVDRLVRFARRMADHYELTYNPDTKASRALKELEDLNKP